MGSRTVCGALGRHSREGGNPAGSRAYWIPALRFATAGMTILKIGRLFPQPVFKTALPTVQTGGAARIYWSSHKSSQRQPLYWLLTMIVSPFTWGCQQG